MSSLGDVARKALRPARKVLSADGVADILTIESGADWKCTRAEERTERDYLEGGQQVEVNQVVVGETENFETAYTGTPQSYLGKAAALNGDSFTVSYVLKGEVFTEIGLRGEEEAP